MAKRLSDRRGDAEMSNHTGKRWAHNPLAGRLLHMPQDVDLSDVDWSKGVLESYNPTPDEEQRVRARILAHVTGACNVDAQMLVPLENKPGCEQITTE